MTRLARTTRKRAKAPVASKAGLRTGNAGITKSPIKPVDAKSKKSSGNQTSAAPKPPPVNLAESLQFVTPAVRERLARLGIFRLADVALHLPLRYEDETTLVDIADAVSGSTVQVEGKVLETKVEFRPRRQLVCRIEDHSGTLTMRFFNFYPSQQRALAERKPRAAARS